MIRATTLAFASLLAAIVMMVVDAAPACGQDDPRTSAVKAAFVYNFAKFTKWPEASTLLSDRIRLCFLGSRLAREAILALEGKKVNGRPVEVLEYVKSRQGCHITFVGASADRAAVRSAIEQNHGLPTLLVSDVEGFARSGGHIELYISSGRLRFKVNLASVSRVNIQLSSKLLQLAEIVAGAGQ